MLRPLLAFVASYLLEGLRSWCGAASAARAFQIAPFYSSPSFVAAGQGRRAASRDVSEDWFSQSIAQRFPILFWSR
ncbi:hypothetical protein F5879DRAFT_932164 [Lentinula edodes]|nr:hypothetical protein F5879DRAFT_932164 [Lentinula edodes]